jgi:hypothetical protein
MEAPFCPECSRSALISTAVAGAPAMGCEHCGTRFLETPQGPVALDNPEHDAEIVSRGLSLDSVNCIQLTLTRLKSGEWACFATTVNPFARIHGRTVGATRGQAVDNAFAALDLQALPLSTVEVPTR